MGDVKRRKAAGSEDQVAPAKTRRRRSKGDQVEDGAFAPCDMSFEDGMRRLEEIVQALEDGTRSLDESLQLFGEAMALIRLCNGKLDAAEAKVQMLLKDSGGDGPRLVDFDEDDEESSLASVENLDEDDEEDEDDDDHGPF